MIVEIVSLFALGSLILIFLRTFDRTINLGVVQVVDGLGPCPLTMDTALWGLEFFVEILKAVVCKSWAPILVCKDRSPECGCSQGWVQVHWLVVQWGHRIGRIYWSCQRGTCRMRKVGGLI